MLDIIGGFRGEIDIDEKSRKNARYHRRVLRKKTTFVVGGGGTTHTHTYTHPGAHRFLNDSLSSKTGKVCGGGFVLAPTLPKTVIFFSK